MNSCESRDRNKDSFIVLPHHMLWRKRKELRFSTNQRNFLFYVSTHSNPEWIWFFLWKYLLLMNYFSILSNYMICWFNTRMLRKIACKKKKKNKYCRYSANVIPVQMTHMLTCLFIQFHSIFVNIQYICWINIIVYFILVTWMNR